MTELTRPERLQIMLTPKELKALDDWRFQHRMPSRAAAVRELLKRGLTAAMMEIAGDGRRSREFRITGDDQHAAQRASDAADAGAGEDA